MKISRRQKVGEISLLLLSLKKLGVGNFIGAELGD